MSAKDRPVEWWVTSAAFYYWLLYVRPRFAKNIDARAEHYRRVVESAGRGAKYKISLTPLGWDHELPERAATNESALNLLAALIKAAEGDPHAKWLVEKSLRGKPITRLFDAICLQAVADAVHEIRIEFGPETIEVSYLKGVEWVSAMTMPSTLAEPLRGHMRILTRTGLDTFRPYLLPEMDQVIGLDFDWRGDVAHITVSHETTEAEEQGELLSTWAHSGSRFARACLQAQKATSYRPRKKARGETWVRFLSGVHGRLAWPGIYSMDAALRLACAREILELPRSSLRYRVGMARIEFSPILSEEAALEDGPLEVQAQILASEDEWARIVTHEMLYYAPIPKLFAALCGEAVELGAGAIRLRPSPEGLLVDFEQDSCWKPAMTIPENLVNPLRGHLRRVDRVGLAPFRPYLNDAVSDLRRIDFKWGDESIEIVLVRP